MASSKLYPRQGMKATRTLRPSASSPMSVQGPSASTCALRHALPHLDDGLLVDAGVLVGAFELDELVDVRAHFARKLAFVGRAFHAHDDALGIHRIHHAGALAQHHGAGIAGRHVLHAGAHVGGVGAQQRHGLALHVRSHQRAVGVVVLQERNQAGGHRDELLGADVDVLDLLARLQHEVAGLARVAQLGNDAALLIQRHVGLGDGPLVFLPRRKVLAVGFVFGGLLLGRPSCGWLLRLPAAARCRPLCNPRRPGSGS